MIRTKQRFALDAARTASAWALAVSVALAPNLLFAYEKDAHQDRVEVRIKSMHEKLKITSAQEAKWTKLTDVMRENAKLMDTLTQSRSDKAKTMSAVDDLKSYGEIAEAHADGLKKFTPAFADLYDSMTDAQKKEADMLFRRGSTAHHDKISKSK